MLFDHKYENQDENQLWKDYKGSRNQNIREFLVKKYAPLVKYVAGKVAIGMPNNTDFDDLVSDGTIGLLDAIEKYEPERNIKFKTYAITRIRGAIFDGLRERDWIPRSVRQKIKEIENLLVELENKFGHPPTDEEIAASLDLSVDEFNKLMSNLSGTSSVASLNETWPSGSDDDEISMLENLKGSDTFDPSLDAEKKEVIDIISRAIQSLPENEKKVLVLYYYEDLTLKEIGEVLGVTESRVSQLHTRAIMMIKAKLKQIKFL